jgi:hypothetical protein
LQKTITTYSELERYGRAFADGHFEVFLLVGNPGLEKSTMLRKALEGKDARWIEGTLSAFQLYCETWEYKDHIFAIDDVDDLYGDRNAVRLLKCLCQTEPVKRLGWHTNASKLDKDGIPREFGTKSPVAIIANEWKALNKNVGALEDRGILIHFRPTAREVHQRVRAWFADDEIYGFIGGLLHLIAEPSMRHYVNCLRLKEAGLDWREALYESVGITGETLAVARLLDDPSFASGEARVAEFVERTGRSRATYFRIARKLRGCEPQDGPRDTSGADRRLSEPPQAPGGEVAGTGTDPDPSRLYVRNLAGSKVGSITAARLAATPKSVKILRRAILKGAIVTYRGEVLNGTRLLEVVEAARAEAEGDADSEPKSNNAA